MTDLEDYEEVNFCMYQWLIGRLIYLACRTRSDIIFVVRQFSKYNADTGKDHLQEIKKVVHYLCGTIKMDLIYGWENNRIIRKPPTCFLDRCCR